MRYDLIQLLRCPSGCEAGLKLENERVGGDGILSGALRCSECGGVYPIDDGIPRMLPMDLTKEHDAASDESQTQKLSEIKARDEQVVDYDRMWYLNLFGLIEIPVTLLHMGLTPQHTLLEAGCGTGRMTREFATRCTRMVAADFSFESLRVNARKLRQAGIKNVDLIQADLCAIPLRTEAFDRVVSCQVLEHIPTPACREAAIQEMARVLKHGGNLTLSAYQYSLLMRVFGKKQGEHDGGIYFFRFERDELRDLLARHLQVESITGALVYHYLAKCIKA